MLKWLVESALHQRLLVGLGAVALMVLGARAARDTPLDVFPEFARPLIEIQTEAPGLSTTEVEGLITLPLENALGGIPNLETLRSKSVLGLSSVVMLFKEGTDLLKARQLVQERLAVEAGRLPSVARAPVLLAPLSSTSRALKIGVYSKTLTQMELTEAVRWTIRPRLMAVPGVANVAVWGARERQLQVLVDPQRLRANDLSLDTVLQGITDATQVTAGGFLDTPNQRLAVRHVTPFSQPEDLGDAVIAVRGGSPIRASDVARVVVGHAPPIGDAVINGGEGLLLIVEKQPSSNTLDLTQRVEAAIAALRPALKDVEIDTTIFRPAGFIQLSLKNLRNALLLGGVLVVMVLLLFLRDLRAAVISFTAIPLSLVAALVALWLSGGTLNTLFLAGLVIALGEVVDDAIIDVENIRRRLLIARGDGRSAMAVVLSASLEVRSAVVYASLIVTLVFLPVFFMGGLGGAFFRPLATAYVLSILASLMVALTVTPAMCLWLLPASTHSEKKRGALVEGMHRLYVAMLPPLMKRPRHSVALLVATPILALALTPFLGDAFLPDFKETDFLMHWLEKPGASVEASRRSTLRVGQELMKVPGVRNFGSHIGRAEVADEVVGPNFTEHWISIDPAADYDATVARINEVIEGYPGLFRDVLTYLKERIKEALSGGSGAIVVRIFGPDLVELRKNAEAVAATVKDIPGVGDLKVETQVLVPQIEVRLIPDRAALHGVTAGQVRRSAGILLNGIKVGEVHETQRISDVVVWSEPDVRADLNALRALLIETPAGARVPLGMVADVVVVPAPNEIKREANSRRIDVSCNVKKDADLGAVAREIETRVKGMQWARGYHPELMGEYAARQASRDQMVVLSILAMLGIFLLLYLDFRSLRLATLLMATLPFALVGGVIGALLGGGVLSLGSLVGFVSVLGIAARNGIMIVSHYRHLRVEENLPLDDALILRGAEERLTPVMMTALCAGLALLPIVVRGNLPGYEIEHPMAVVILGGLVSSTVLNLLLLPALYKAYGESR